MTTLSEHMMIFVSVATLIGGALIVFYLYTIYNKSGDKIVLALLYYLLFVNIDVMINFILEYVFYNIFVPCNCIQSIVQSMVWKISLFFVWIGVIYSITNISIQLIGKKVSRRFEIVLLIVAALFLAGFGAGLLHFTNSSSQELFGLVYFISLLVAPLYIFVLSSYAIIYSRLLPDVRRKTAVRTFVGLIIFGYIAYIIVLLHSAHLDFERSLVRLYQNLAIILWFIWFYSKLIVKAEITLDNGRLVDLIKEKFGITSREMEILNLLIKGKNNKEIEDLLFISVNTVRNHVSFIYKKLGINSRGQLMNLILTIGKEKSS
ncbi:MAG: hypothetical protein A2V66_05395 [Ignavibacteria bacterium RBG_13_36_8]|nr:MAG: hypothetical protein A2V66_05395 [Ignavibacteria bacterium RBG_13_36_8]